MSNTFIPPERQNDPKVAEAIVDLHEKGFIHDFQITGNKLYWIQGKCSLPTGNFSILEIIRMPETRTTLFGLLDFEHNVKGILLEHHRSDNVQASPILNEKLIQLHHKTFRETC